MKQDVYFFGKTAYVTYKFLIDRGVPSSTIYNNTSNKVIAPKRWFTAPLPNNKKIKLIEYNSIPHSLVVKFKLPDYNRLREIADLQIEQVRNELSVNVSNHVKTILDLEYYSWEDLKIHYENKFISGEKLEMFCKTHAILSKLIELNQLGYKLKDLFSAYYQYDNMVFETEHYRSFCNKIRQIKKGKSIEEVLIHGLVNKPSNNLKKDEDVLIEIQRIFNEGKVLNASQILDQVNDYLIRSNRKTVSRSLIYSVISQNCIKNKALISRYGLKYAMNNILPYSHFISPSQEGVLWVIDGSRFQFAYKRDNGQGKYGFLTFFIVMEAFNRKIIGYSYDDSENSVMVKKALEMSCESLLYLPREIISDNSPAFKSADMERIQASFKIWGGHWHKVNNNPRDNSYAERFFGVFQESFCKKYEGYIGDGIKSKNLNGKPSPEEVKQFLSSKKIKSRDDVILLLTEVINDYNASSKRGASIKKNVVQNIMNSHKNIDPIPLETIKFCLLFWPYKELKVSHGEVSFEFKKIAYIYQIYDEELLYRLHGTSVKVSYNPKDMSKVLIFDLKNDLYLTTLERYKLIPKAKIERSSTDNEEFHKTLGKTKRLKRKMIKGGLDIFTQSEQNRAKLPPKLLDLGIGTKSENEESEKEFMSDELEKISEVNIGSGEKEDIDFDSILKQMYSKKGNLKTFKYGSN
ncbi:MAG: Mu transposase C-terminal domain-containing protein [Bacteroidota bacterium]|nr:Mu transposase C-terminal domain-containing protein [Bacteroidota bacterium]